MRFLKALLRLILTLIAMAVCAALAVVIYLHTAQWGFDRAVDEGEKESRMGIVSAAEDWLGTVEGSQEHEDILEIYNTHEPLAVGYVVQQEDNWCATFASAVAIQENLTDIIPTECGCERQIGLWQALGCWEEDDNYMPLPGDYIYYAWDEEFDFGDCTGWADHVGIVVGTAGPFIKVIEGNKDDMVTYRIILRADYRVRGYGLPDYGAK